MPRVMSFSTEIKTGETGTNTPVRCCINGHTVAFEEATGSTAAQGLYTAEIDINSFIHSLTIVGPDEGKWTIETISVTYTCDGIEPYTVRFGQIELDDTTEVNIWAEATPSTFYV